MAIDEAIEYNEYLKTYMEINDKKGTHKFLEENHIALSMAIDTMRKYQKIEQIVAHYRDNVRDKVTNENMEKILEVVEDGTN